MSKQVNRGEAHLAPTFIMRLDYAADPPVAVVRAARNTRGSRCSRRCEGR